VRKIYFLLFLFISLQGASIDLKKTYNNLQCDDLYRMRIYNSCYSYRYRGPLEVDYTIYGNLIDKKNYVSSRYWRVYRPIPKEYRQHNFDYYKQGYHKGHLANDANFDYDKILSKLTYYLSVNSVPMLPSVNRYSWYKVEERERYLARLYEKVNVINLVDYTSSYKKLNNNITIPTGFYKVIYNKKMMECYYVPNEFVDYKTIKLNDFLIKCDDVPYIYLKK